ncbi:hypothetical protein [Pedobacter mendelii]|uniref:hypothetical protein n=1 Tax=Pedobacter mendelii TaxID=1908240 RepID=UPI00166A1394|nr:hypothetical protein [Pedobacter mendelii]
MISHYLEHKQQQEDLSLWGFLCIHYANGDVHDSDYLQDMKLPFKTCSNQGHGEKPLNMRLAESLVPEDMVTEYLPPRLGYYKFMETAALRGSIWQPPKLS